MRNMYRHGFSRGNFEPINNGFATNSTAAWRDYLAVCIFTFCRLYSSSAGLYFLHIFPLTFTDPLVFHERVILGPNST